ncbi:unnamed protein product [Prorocentrum cordatum]|uniref:Uncharacterized protein n=1 Tax=Prorocentrum cordatum TaxID=2364126 RepID=A0ABN9PH05_9DINO|nr:unnamed protein product [Polarella glacialis]
MQSVRAAMLPAGLEAQPQAAAGRAVPRRRRRAAPSAADAQGPPRDRGGAGRRRLRGGGGRPAPQVRGAGGALAGRGRAGRAAGEQLRDTGWPGLALHVVIFSAWVGLSLPTTVMEVATGFVWGAAWGFFASLLCKTIGSVIAFVVVLLLRQRLGWEAPRTPS